MHRAEPRRRLPEWLIGLLIALVLALVALGVGAWLGVGDDPGFETGGPAPTPGDTPAQGISTEGVEMETFDGETVSLSDYQGSPVVLNFWASWCAPCIAEMPDFQAVYSRVGDRVVFVGVNSQDPDREAAEQLADETGVEYLLTLDRQGEIHSHFRGFGMPMTVFIAPDGKVLEIHNGILTEEDLADKIEEHFDI